MDIGFEVEMAFADGHGAAIDVTDGRIIAGEEVRHDDLRKNALDFEGGEEGDGAGDGEDDDDDDSFFSVFENMNGEEHAKQWSGEPESFHAASISRTSRAT